MKIALDEAWMRLRPLEAVVPPTPAEGDIRLALARIVSHPLFAKSIKLQRFLTYVVEEALAGRAERLKAYNIATVALGRPDSFDPSQDPIVRVEASRLRRALSAYYAGDGVQDHVRILLNAGSYQPLFELSGQDANATEAHSGPHQLLSRQSADQRSRHDMSSRERILLGLVVLLFLITFCNTAMLTLTVQKLDEVERAMGLVPATQTRFTVP
jgi:hypothetical protein